MALEAPKTYVVNTTADHDDGTCDGSDCSLREAINAANAAAAPGVAGITFALGGGPQQISVLGSALPPITVPVSIDGTTQPGAPAGTMGVTLNGDGAGASDGLVLAPGSGGSTIRGLAIRRLQQQRPGRHSRSVRRQPDRRRLHRHRRRRDGWQLELGWRRRGGQQQRGRRPERGRPRRHLRQHGLRRQHRGAWRGQRDGQCRRGQLRRPRLGRVDRRTERPRGQHRRHRRRRFRQHDRRDDHGHSQLRRRQPRRRHRSTGRQHRQGECDRPRAGGQRGAEQRHRTERVGAVHQSAREHDRRSDRWRQRHLGKRR